MEREELVDEGPEKRPASSTPWENWILEASRSEPSAF
jgi:hypothetical protein